MDEPVVISLLAVSTFWLAAGAKERVGLSAAVHEGAVNTGIGTAPLYDTVSAVTAQCDQGEKPSG